MAALERMPGVREKPRSIQLSHAKNEKLINGVKYERRYAYLKKNDRDRFGILIAVDFRDARRFLGSGYWIKSVWLSCDEVRKCCFDYEYKRKIVSSALREHAGEMGNK